MHKCDEKCASSDRLDGLHFICHKCSSKTLADCAAKLNDTVINMLLLLKVVVADDKKQPKANVTIDTKTEFDVMFGRNSTFGYICEQCKSDAPTEAKDDEIVGLQMKIEELQKSLDEKVELIQTMTDASDKNASNKSSKDKHVLTDYFKRVNKNEEKVESDCPNTDELLSKVNTLLTTEFQKISVKFTSDMEEVKKQCDKILNKGQHDKNNTAEKGPNPFKKTMQHKVSFGTDVETTHQQTCIEFSTKLIPNAQTPVQNPMCYSMHVSKFPKAATVDDLTEHIMNNTTIINPDAFKIEKLGRAGSDYNSFKISTLQMSTYDIIKQIWAPHYVARDFNENRKMHTPNVKTNNGYGTPYRNRYSFGKSNDRGNERVTQTPRNRWNGNRRTRGSGKNERGDKNAQDDKQKTSDGQDDLSGKTETNKSMPPSQQFILVPVQQQNVQPAQNAFLGSHIAPTQQTIQHMQQPYQYPVHQPIQYLQQPSQHYTQ